MKSVAEVIGVSRSNLVERMDERAKKRIGRPPLPDDKLVAEIKAVIAERVHAILKRQALAAGLKPHQRRLPRTMARHYRGPREGHAEDEFIYVLEGEIMLIEDGSTTVLQRGDAAGFKAGVANGHHLVNKSQRDALYLEVGTRAKRERAHYPDVDLIYDRDESGVRFSRRSGEAYPKRDG